MSNLSTAISIAVRAHDGQTDKPGKPYILHPLRLMLKFNSEVEMIVAVMHDVVEDSDYTLNDLKKFGFEYKVVEAIDSLTKRDGEEYDCFILRVRGNELARKIKIEDIKDNLDVTRLSVLTDADVARVRKYHQALKILLK